MTQLRASDEGSLLLTLQEVSQLVSHSHDAAETLDNIVRLIQTRFHSAVCSVYLLEPNGDELVLAATVGLKPDSVGRVRMRLGEGLTGLVAEQMAPVQVADAFHHPRFKYFPEAGEDAYHSFLGVPLVVGGALLGVIVVQTADAHAFSPGEARMLVTVAAQLASLVGDARLLERVAALAHAQPQATTPADRPTTSVCQGVPLSPGRGLGQAYVLDSIEEWRKSVHLRADDAVTEKARLHRALEAARDEMGRLGQRIAELVGEAHGAILQAQLLIMQDRSIERDLHACLNDGASAEGALLTTLDQYVAAFQKVTTPFFQERVYDIKDVFHRLLWQLRPRSAHAPEDGDRVVLVAREASVMELFAVEPDRLAAVIVEQGGAQSHAAILARSLGIPMVGQVADFGDLQRPGRLLLVDGTTGSVTLDPPGERLSKTVPTAVPIAVSIHESLPAGLPRVEVNINLLHEVGEALKIGAASVGLFRSEFLFLARRTLPTEEEQFGVYRKLVERLGGRPVSIRTFDLRPDKLAAYSHFGAAAARPFDWRQVLDSPSLQGLFRDQVRAVLRAAALGPVRLLIPLVTSLELLEFVNETLARARNSLADDDLAFAADVPLGAMIEVAAAVPLVADWADLVDYFALGTNDLTASALAIDRDDPLTSGLADPLHPGMLRLIDEVVVAARKASRPVTVCGEMAADSLGTLALTALQVDALSVPVSRYQSTRGTVANCGLQSLSELRDRLLRQRTAREVRNVLTRWQSGQTN